MGFVRAPRKAEPALVIPAPISQALPDLPPSPSLLPQIPQPVVPLPQPDLSNFAAYSGMKSQASGYARPPTNVIRNVVTPVNIVSDNPNLMVNVISASNVTPTPKYVELLPTVAIHDVTKVNGPELYIAIDEVETKRQLRQLHDIYTSGFIQQYEYEHRKGQLERYLQKVLGYCSIGLLCRLLDRATLAMCQGREPTEAFASSCPLPLEVPLPLL